MNSNLSTKCISAPASACGHIASDKLGGLTIEEFGQLLFPANLSARQAKDLGLLTSGIYGPQDITSSHSAARSELLASKDGLAWIEVVSTDMENAGYSFGAVDLCAAGVGAPHIRPRLWWIADTERYEQPREEPCGWTPRRMGRIVEPLSWDGGWPLALTKFRSVDDGHPRSVGSTDAFRNAIVAPVAEEFLRAALIT